MSRVRTRIALCAAVAIVTAIPIVVLFLSLQK
jgi:ABC-type maltose transport system permease subunit